MFGCGPALVRRARSGEHRRRIHVRAEHLALEPLRRFGAIPGEQARRHDFRIHRIVEQGRVEQVRDARQHAQRGLVADLLVADIAQVLGDGGRYALAVVQLVPVPDAVQEEVDIAVDRDALHVERIRMHGEEQAVLLAWPRACAAASPRS